MSYVERKRPRGGLPRMSPRIQDQIEKTKAELEAFNIDTEEYPELSEYRTKGAYDLPPGELLFKQR